MFQYFHARHFSQLEVIPLYLDLSLPPDEVAERAAYLTSTIANHPFRDKFRFSPSPVANEVFYTEAHVVTSPYPQYFNKLITWLTLPTTKQYMSKILSVSDSHVGETTHVSYMGKVIVLDDTASEGFVNDLNDWLVLTALESP